MGCKTRVWKLPQLQFGQPELVVRELYRDGRLLRDAYVQGRWHIWIYCCAWRFSMDGAPIAWSEDERQDISRATGLIDGQVLNRIEIDPPSGKSRFELDLGGHLETWPVGDDPTEEQWHIYGPDDVFSYRADGLCSKQPADTPAEQERWFAVN